MTVICSLDGNTSALRPFSVTSISVNLHLVCNLYLRHNRTLKNSKTTSDLVAIITTKSIASRKLPRRHWRHGWQRYK